MIKKAFLLFILALALAGPARAQGPQISEASQTCLDCHQSVTPGIVADWRQSAHASLSPAQALAKPELARKVSAAKVPPALANQVVGCAECHTLNLKSHQDSFDHEDQRVQVVVSPVDCATCHPQEAKQYQANLMSQAHGNLMSNPLLKSLTQEINAPRTLSPSGLVRGQVPDQTLADSCLACHGTRIMVQGMKTRQTSQGEMDFPVLVGWPNQGVGRINPDASKGSCTACHARHGFSIKVARGPYTCGQCHKGPDVPAYKVYQASKHGNIYSSQGGDWDLKAVPWTAGKDFSAPTCAACHMSLVVDSEGEVLAQRSHQVSDRLYVRLFGLIYAHPHPISPDTSGIKAPGGLPLPSNLGGHLASQYLINPTEQAKRRANMQGVCQGCHAGGVVQGHFARLDHMVQASNDLVRAATGLVQQAWQRGLAQGPAQGGSPFDEAIEKTWVEQWLFFANGIRLASAMMGADYGSFDGGRWQLSKGLEQMRQWLDRAGPVQPAKPGR